jgi:hypothetical protein
MFRRDLFWNGGCDWTAGIPACHAAASKGVEDYDSTRQALTSAEAAMSGRQGCLRSSRIGQFLHSSLRSPPFSDTISFHSLWRSIFS